MTTMAVLDKDPDEKMTEKQKVEFLQNTIKPSDKKLLTHVELLSTTHSANFTGALQCMSGQVSRIYASVQEGEKSKKRQISELNTGNNNARGGGRGRCATWNDVDKREEVKKKIGKVLTNDHHTRVNAKNLARMWNIGLDSAKRTLQALVFSSDLACKVICPPPVLAVWPLRVAILGGRTAKLPTPSWPVRSWRRLSIELWFTGDSTPRLMAWPFIKILLKREAVYHCNAIKICNVVWSHLVITLLNLFGVGHQEKQEAWDWWWKAGVKQSTRETNRPKHTCLLDWPKDSVETSGNTISLPVDEALSL